MNAGANTYLPRSVALTASGVTFFARHGQCRSNTEWPITDYHDLIDPLTELGKAQARNCGRFFAGLVPSSTWRIYSSALRRAIQTAEIIADETDSVLVRPDPRLNEYSNALEDHPTLLARLEGFLSELRAVPTSENERHLVVTHGHVLECLLCEALGAEIRVIDKGGHGGQAGVAGHANGGVSAFYNGELLLWNAQSHLSTGHETVAPVTT